MPGLDGLPPELDAGPTARRCLQYPGTSEHTTGVRILASPAFTKRLTCLRFSVVRETFAASVSELSARRVLPLTV
jgi:hypothetical protein